MRIALAQIESIVGAPEDNASLILARAVEAAAMGAELVVFPELAISGYPPRDLLLVSSFVRSCDTALERIVRELPTGVTIIVGTPRRRVGVEGGRTLANTAVVIQRGKILAEIGKALLPTYDVFDERRYFEPAPLGSPRVVTIGKQRIGVLVCEDLWNDRLLWPTPRLYDSDPVAEAIEQGATILVDLSASPFVKRKHEVRRRIVAHAAARWRVPVVYVNAVGGQDGLIFDGNSLAFAPDGPLASLPWFEQALAVVDTESAPRAPLPAPDDQALLCGALTTGIEGYARKTGMSSFVLGLSGGVDSALVAALATLAFRKISGSGTSVGLAMPSRFSSDHSVEDAKSLARGLGLNLQVVPIEPAHRSYEQMLADVLPPARQPDVTFENVQARIRGALLMAYSNRTGALLLTTGNKSECAVGYCTLYGDTCGGLAVIADLWKHEVYSLCRYLNAHEVAGAIPESTLTKPPSAELRPDQRDDQSLPPYEILDPILEAIVEHELGVEDAAELTKQPVEQVRAIARLVYRAEYKRKQFAPTLKVSTRAWVGRDYPLASGHRP